MVLQNDISCIAQQAQLLRGNKRYNKRYSRLQELCLIRSCILLKCDSDNGLNIAHVFYFNKNIKREISQQSLIDELKITITIVSSKQQENCLTVLNRQFLTRFFARS